MKLGMYTRKKIKIDRSQILTSAVVNFESYCDCNNILEFDFEDEIGSGTGPTLEFYALIAQEVLDTDFKLIRTCDDGTYMPQPMSPLYLISYQKLQKIRPDYEISQQCKKDLEKSQILFNMLGQCVAKAIQDERIFDLPFNALFYKILLDQPLDLSDIFSVDQNLGNIIIDLQQVVLEKQKIQQNEKLSPTEKSIQIQSLTYKGCQIQDLVLNFTFPGFAQIDLIDDGYDMPVNISNLEKYIDLVIYYFLFETVKTQIYSFKKGFTNVLPLSVFDNFQFSEMNSLFCGDGSGKKWDIQHLQDYIKPDHGFNYDNQCYKNFLEILSEFDVHKQKKFLMFVTGCPKLPYNGFKGLSPCVTVVKKIPTSYNQNNDDYLPSVMTCQNYIKLPEYSTKQILKEKLLYCMEEGQKSFSLS